MRARGVNLEAARRGATPSIWLCAHLDSKSQPIPTLVRTTGIVLEAAGILLTFLLCCAIAAGMVVHTFFWTFAAAVTLVGAIPVVLSMTGARSPGALDNASGVAAVISAARQVASDPRVGVLITDAEELGLAGARAWTLTHATRDVIVLNSDGVDDIGEIQVMYTGRAPSVLLGIIGRASRETAIRCKVGRLVPGLLTDSVAFAAAGLATVTFSKGAWRSLARVHSRRDDLSRLRGTGIAEVAGLLAATIHASDKGQWKRSSSA
jgi:hypothetical protein